MFNQHKKFQKKSLKNSFLFTFFTKNHKTDNHYFLHNIDPYFEKKFQLPIFIFIPSFRRIFENVYRRIIKQKKFFWFSSSKLILCYIPFGKTIFWPAEKSSLNLSTVYNSKRTRFSNVFCSALGLEVEFATNM